MSGYSRKAIYRARSQECAPGIPLRPSFLHLQRKEGGREINGWGIPGGVGRGGRAGAVPGYRRVAGGLADAPPGSPRRLAAAVRNKPPPPCPATPPAAAAD